MWLPGLIFLPVSPPFCPQMCQDTAVKWLKPVKGVPVFVLAVPPHKKKGGGQLGWEQPLEDFTKDPGSFCSFCSAILSLWLCPRDRKVADGLPSIVSKFQAGRRGKDQQTAFLKAPLAKFQDWATCSYNRVWREVFSACRAGVLKRKCILDRLSKVVFLVYVQPKLRSWLSKMQSLICQFT